MIVVLALVALVSCAEPGLPKTLDAPSWAIGSWHDVGDSKMRLTISDRDMIGSMYLESQWISVDLRAAWEMAGDALTVEKQTSDGSIWEIVVSQRTDYGIAKSITKITKTATGITYYELDTINGSIVLTISYDLVPNV